MFELRVKPMIDERMARRALILIALSGLAGGIAVKFVAWPELAQWLSAFVASLADALMGLMSGLAIKPVGRAELAQWLWTAGAIPVVVSLALSIVRGLRAGRMGASTRSLFWPWWRLWRWARRSPRSS
jgi:hypothetical protein